MGIFVYAAESLNVASNQFSGTIPNISNMVKLINLHLFENKFTGEIPHEIYKLQSLEILFLSSNKFSGAIPASLQVLSATLRGLYLSDNNFDGTIPDDLCSFGALGTLLALRKSLEYLGNFAGRLDECLKPPFLFLSRSPNQYQQRHYFWIRTNSPVLSLPVLISYKN